MQQRPQFCPVQYEHGLLDEPMRYDDGVVCMPVFHGGAATKTCTFYIVCARSLVRSLRSVYIRRMFFEIAFSVGKYFAEL